MKPVKRRLAEAVTAARLGTVIIRLWGPALVVQAGTLWLSVALHMIDINFQSEERMVNLCVFFWECDIYHFILTCVYRRSEK